ncbi:MAG: Rpn family recombination-promoting nuclease/putative transposase [Legionellales bacterium]|nr:Rpn family recombination-promoting nuclease/putative transposase [Legionellales bacterium]
MSTDPNDVMKFEGSGKIRDVSFLTTAQNPDIAYLKQSLVDVLCTDEKGHQYIIEMQVAKTSGFEKRAQYYAAKAYSRQLNCGEDYTQLKAVIFIAITDFIMLPNTPDYRSTHIILDEKTYNHDLKDFSYTFLELPKFHQSIDELSTLIEKWMYFFKHAEETSEEELRRIVGSDEIIYQAYEALNRFSWSEIELNTYEQEEKRERDAQAIIKQKLIDAKEEGKADERKHFVRNLLRKGWSDESIIDNLEITPLELSIIKKELDLMSDS